MYTAFRTFIRNVICHDLLTYHTTCNVSYPIMYAVVNDDQHIHMHEV